MAGTYEQSYEASVSIKCKDILNQLHDCQLIRNYSTLWSCTPHVYLNISAWVEFSFLYAKYNYVTAFGKCLFLRKELLPDGYFRCGNTEVMKEVTWTAAPTRYWNWMQLLTPWNTHVLQNIDKECSWFSSSPLEKTDIVHYNTPKALPFTLL
jgi:hypothetical protein